MKHHLQTHHQQRAVIRPTQCSRGLLATLLLAAMLFVPSAQAGLSDTITRIKPSIVGVGSLQHSRKERANLRGSGFVVGDGRYVLTNAHVIPPSVNSAKGEFLAIFYRQGKGTGSRRAEEVARDQRHDISLLKIRGKPLPALRLDAKKRVREGELYAFTGFPLGSVLGLYPATHRGIISALTPFAIPVHGGKRLTLERRKRLAAPFEVYQLDAVAYPGNSGSPLYDPNSGAVVAVINAVFVKGSREDALARPSGISFAIPIKYGTALLRKVGIKP